jgi:hypothetical protein
MKGYVLFIIIVILLYFFAINSTDKSSFVNYIASYAPDSQRGWYNRPNWKRFGFPTYSYWETFENINDRPDSIKPEKNDILEYPPNTGSPANIYNNSPYHLLSDKLEPPRAKESLSCVNSRSCYAADFNRMIAKTGNFRQMTNNYKRGYPDSCSAPYQELVLNFYKTDLLPEVNN